MTMDLRESIKEQTDVALALAKRVMGSEGKESNLVFSPLSIHFVLSMIAAGSEGGASTQLLSFLKSQSAFRLDSFCSELVSIVLADGSPTGGPKLSLATAIWLDASLSIKPSFKQIIDDVYKVPSTHLDFQNKAVEVVPEINSWTEKKTGGIIKQIIPPGSVDSKTRLIFGNGFYFNGAWSDKFEASATKDYDFHLINGSPVKVPFMTSKKKQTIGAYDGFKVVRLAYKQGDDKRKFSMYLILPDAKDGLPALVEKMCSQSGFLANHLPQGQVEVGEFRIPKFKISFAFDAATVLKSLGVVLPFSAGGLAQIVDSLGGKDLGVSNIFHKSFIEVNEEGAEAGAASGMVVADKSLGPAVDFVADRPFMYLIREDLTEILLFVGHVLNPQAG